MNKNKIYFCEKFDIVYYTCIDIYVELYKHSTLYVHLCVNLTYNKCLINPYWIKK